MSSDLRETVARARELLFRQGVAASSSTLQFVTEEEGKRFLMACNLDVERAAEGIARRAKFLSKYQPPHMKIDWKALKQMLPLSWAENRGGDSATILFASFSRTFTISDFTLACGGEHGRLFLEWIGEEIAERCIAAKQPLTVIVDVADVSLGQTTTPEFDQFVRFGASFFQTVHPERLKNVFFLNTPPTFSVMMHAFKRVCSAQTLRKFVAIESIYQMNNIIVEDYIPRSMGGKASFREDTSVYASQFASPHDAVKQTVPVPYPPLSLSSSPRTMRQVETQDLSTGIQQLLNLLKSSIDKANECELRHVEENLRLRKKVSSIRQDSHRAIEEEEAELRNKLNEAIDERDAYRKAVDFARNFIDQEDQDRRQIQLDIEREIEQKREENLALVEALQSAFGSDAPNLFL